MQELVEATEPDHVAAEAADVMYFMMTRCVAAGTSPPRPFFCLRSFVRIFDIYPLLSSHLVIFTTITIIIITLFTKCEIA